MIKWLTAVARLACIVCLNHEWNAAFSFSVRSIIVRPPRRPRQTQVCRCRTRGRLVPPTRIQITLVGRPARRLTNG